MVDEIDDVRSQFELRIQQWPPKYKNGVVGTRANLFYFNTKKFLQSIGRLIYRTKYENELVLKRMEERKKGFIFIANHTSGFDPVFVIGKFEGKMYILALDNPMFDYSLIRNFMTSVGIIPVAWRGNNQTLSVSYNILQKDYALIVLPEANFVHSRRRIFGKTGFAVLAAMTGKAVLPVGIKGVDYRIFNELGPHLNKKVNVNYALPRIVKDEFRIKRGEKLSEEVAKGITDELMLEMRKASNYAGLRWEDAKTVFKHYNSIEKNKYTEILPEFQ